MMFEDIEAGESRYLIVASLKDSTRFAYRARPTLPGDSMNAATTGAWVCCKFA
ncbi:MAG: hypothetical protein ACXVXP_09695 [Mycobacteriaceae bacterium]